MSAERGPSRTTALAAIGAGGVVGTLLRAGAGALRPEAAGSVPTTTLAVNLVGALVLGLLLGLFARCHLGPPYVDHRLTVVGHILEHYRPTDIVPPPFDAARTLAQSPVYEYVEVYSDGDIIPVLADGSVS